MDQVKEFQEALAKHEKNISVRQVALRSGINYITLRNIKLGKSKRVTARVASQLRKFLATLQSPAMPEPAPKRVVKPAPKVAKKLGRPPKVVRARRGRPPKAVVQSPVAAPAKTVAFTSVLLGDKLHGEIALAKARLAYLQTLEQAEATYLKAIKK